MEKIDESSEETSTHTVPHGSMVVIEHPCIIKNVDRGLMSLGGATALNSFLSSRKPEKSIGMSLRPEDVQARFIDSRSVETRNLLVRVTVPKWTGRKRKRGSQGPFLPCTGDSFINSQENIDDTYTKPDIESSLAFRAGGPDILRILQDNPDTYSISPLGRIPEVHRFRSLPDHQIATTTDPLMQKLRATVQTYDFSKIKEFRIDGARGLQPGTTIGIPPIMNLHKMPHVYSYRQSAHNKVQVDEKGERKVVNIQPPVTWANQVVSTLVESVPQQPDQDLEPEETLDARMREVIAEFRKVLQERPIMVKRVQEQLLPNATDTQIRRSWPYVGYMFKQGPFRDAIIRYGVDPRTDPRYRFYQTAFYQLPMGPGGIGGSKSVTDPEPEDDAPRDDAQQPLAGRRKDIRTRVVRARVGVGTNRPKDSHIFDGTRLCRDGKTWQVCDITDPLLMPLINVSESELNTIFDPDFSGWYGNGTWALLKTLMKEKITLLARKESSGYDMEAIFSKLIASIPAHITSENLTQLYYTKEDDRHIVRLGAKARTTAMVSFKAKEKIKGLEKGKSTPQEDVGADAMDIDSIDPAITAGDLMPFTSKGKRTADAGRNTGEAAEGEQGEADAMDVDQPGSPDRRSAEDDVEVDEDEDEDGDEDGDEDDEGADGDEEAEESAEEDQDQGEDDDDDDDDDDGGEDGGDEADEKDEDGDDDDEEGDDG